MKPSLNYEMTKEDLDKLLEAYKPQPAIMLHIGGGGMSSQERANAAWEELGQRMGFDHMTVLPARGGDRFFSAVPSGTEAHPSNATPEHQLDAARKLAHAKLREATTAWYEYFGMCEVGPERERAADVYNNVRTATRICNPS